MLKKLSLLILVMGLFVSPAYSQTVEPTKSPRELRGTAKPTLQARLNEVKKRVIENQFESISTRFEHAIEKLNELASRIQSRLDKLQSDGQNVTSQLALIQKAKDEIAMAESSLAEALTIHEAMLESDQPRSLLPDLKAKLGETKTHLKTAHRYMVQIITQIKGLRVGNNKVRPTQTPTP